MASNVITQVQGGQKSVFDGVNTVGDARAKANAAGYAASVNGNPAQDSDELTEGDFVSFAVATKGGKA